MRKCHTAAVACILAVLGFAPAASAADYACPPANQIDCVPAKKAIGPWKWNGGMMTGNTFSPPDQCSPVLNLPNGKKRLFCCYVKCGVFTQDVKAIECTRSPDGQSFTCHN